MYLDACVRDVSREEGSTCLASVVNKEARQVLEQQPLVELHSLLCYYLVACSQQFCSDAQAVGEHVGVEGRRALPLAAVRVPGRA